MDELVKHLRRVAENVLVKVDKYYFPTNFIVLDMEVNQEIPIVLGWPFLATSRAKFDVKEGLPILRVAKKKICLSILRSTPCPYLEWCDYIDQVGGRLLSKRYKRHKKHGLFFMQSCFRVRDNFLDSMNTDKSLLMT